MKDQKSSDLLGTNIEEVDKELDEILEDAEDKYKEEDFAVKADGLFIDNMDAVIKDVKELEEEKKLNPNVVQEGDTGSVMLKGEPHVVIDNEYVPYKEAQVVIQTRKVVSEWLKLQEVIKEANKIIK